MNGFAVIVITIGTAAIAYFNLRRNDERTKCRTLICQI